MEVVIIMSVLIILSGFITLYIAKNNIHLRLITIINVVLMILFINSIGVLKQYDLGIINSYAFGIVTFLINNYLNVRYNLKKLYKRTMTCLSAIYGLSGLALVLEYLRLSSDNIGGFSIAVIPAIISYIVLIGSTVVLGTLIVKKRSHNTFADAVLFAGLLGLILIDIAWYGGLLTVQWNRLIALSIIAVSIIPQIALSNQGLLPLSKEQIFNNMDEMLVIVDQNDIIVDVNTSFKDTFDVNNQAIGISAKAFFEQLPNVTENIYDEINHHKTADISFIGDAGVRTFNVRVQQIHNHLHQHIGKIIFLYDISEHKREMKRLELIGNRDKLTNLYNRNYFDKSISELDQSFNLPLSIVIGDLNGLKLINDTFGHGRGDEFIKKAAEVIEEIVGQKGRTFRIGGDEFCLLLPKTKESDVHQLIGHIETKIGETFKQGIGTISLGYATKKYMNESIKDIWNKADQNMYLTKQEDEKNNKHRIILSVKKWLEETPYETDYHCKRLERLALYLGKKLNLSDTMLRELQTLANLHDIGKYFISKDVLSKVDNLNPDDWNEIFKHPLIGYRIATSIQDLSVVAGGILSHHERWDGTGYPQGLKEEQIPYIARILSVVDAFEVMTAGRPYNKRKTMQEALKEIHSCGGTQFDPSIVEVFVDSMNERLAQKNP